MVKALEGLRVLDLTRMLPGPYASMILADLGARVLKIEDTAKGDPARWSPRHLTRTGSTFRILNRGKQSLSVNLKSAEGVEIFRRLTRDSDVVLEGFRPGVMHRLRLDYESLRSIQPRLIYCSITGYGQTGPMRDRGGHDVNYLALAGVLGLQTDEHGNPVLSGIQVADLGGALFAVIGILAALAARERTGAGQHVDVAMMDVGIALLPVPASRLFAGENVPIGARLPLSGGLACYNLYATADGRHLSLGALEEKFWERFCKAIGREDFVGQHMASQEIQNLMIREIREVLKTRTLAEWLEVFSGTDACAEPVLGLEEASRTPQVRHRGTIMAVNDPRDGQTHQLNLPFKLSVTPPAMGSSAPLLGEHTRDVLASLGYSSGQIQRLIEAGVVRVTNDE
jgi:crotonobetainyl-CoA:carnitine CoA-transferase CaiB-like acyl-CoA transferase